MFQYVLRHNADALGSHHNLLPVNVPYHLVRNFFIRVHRLNIIYPERKDILIIDCIHNRVTMQLIAKSLPCRKKLRILRSAGIYGKNRSSCKSEQMIFLEILYNSCVHISKLAAMALVKNNDDVFYVHFMPRILLNKSCQLLNGSNNDMRARIFQLAFQYGSRGIAVGRSLFKTVIFLHGLIVQILSVNHEQHLINIGQFRSKPCGFK